MPASGENYGIVVNGGRVEAGAMAAGENARAYNAGGAAEEETVSPESLSAHPVRPVHRTILVVDVEGFSARRRTDPHQVAVRDGLYEALRKAFTGAGIPWDACYREDRGDGVFVLAPPDVPKGLFVEALPHALVAALREHNGVHDDRARIRLRMALHAGEVQHDGQGVTGESVIRAFRLVDAAPLKTRLAASPVLLAMIVSPWFYEEVVRHSAGADPDAYEKAQVTVKETETDAWIRLPG